MRSLTRSPVATVVIVVVGGTLLARHIKALGKVPGFSPNG